ncbi:flagellar motor protein MotB [Blastococcus sp. TF02A-26]|uniref:flagellar motor protein MotB n=1 Tax=Blastococcus sp. TF02A-26 TaxID=2250577 RepID=UPI000DEB1484|nr:flagellar motor protein MotB [Blastococcus sp. TF02A-26]RBY86072.1 flagellar motor protein MotB [Blastococcus sp. TF02A-26]
MSSGHGRRRGKKHEEHEEHENHERWLVSAFDMMTLLFVLFVVLFAMSKVDEQKFAALARGMAEAFGAPVQAITGPGTSEDASILPALDAAVDVQIPPAPTAESDTEAAEAEAAALAAEARDQYQSLDGVRERIDQALAAAGYAGAARYEIDERGLVVHIVSDPVLFDAESATLLLQGRAILDAVAPAIAGLPNQIDVEGHANHLPVTPGGPWPSNWELSASRASTVVRALAERGVPEDHLAATGYSSTRPMVPESDPGAITLNRRVDLVVLSTASAEANELLPGIAAGTTAPTPTQTTTASEGGHP